MTSWLSPVMRTVDSTILEVVDEVPSSMEVAAVAVVVDVVVVVLAVLVGDVEDLVGTDEEVVVEAGAATGVFEEGCVNCFGGVLVAESDGNMSEGRSEDSRSPQNLDFLFSFERSCGWDCETGMFGVEPEEELVVCLAGI